MYQYWLINCSNVPCKFRVLVIEGRGVGYIENVCFLFPHTPKSSKKKKVQFKIICAKEQEQIPISRKEPMR